MKTSYYLIEKKLCQSLGLTDYRRKLSDGRYIVSRNDLIPYGIEKAISEGAEETNSDKLYTLI